MPADFLVREALDWDALAPKLAEDIRALRRHDPLRPVTLVVPGVSFKAWITRRLADIGGVCANVRAIHPERAITEIAEACGFEKNRFAAFSAQSLAWRIHTALAGTGDARNSPHADYLRDDADGVKRVQLARRLAELFDRLLIYRPETILAWDRGETPEGENAWLANLWLAATHGLPRRHLPALLASPRTIPDPAKSPDAFFITGVAGIPPTYLRLFSRIAERVPVRAYRTIPSVDFLDDLPRTARERAEAEENEASHHPLLATSGKTARELSALLLDESVDAEFAESHHRFSDTQLGRLRAGIATNKSSPAGSPDGTIVIDSCHGASREVEVLRDRLLDALETIPGLRPRDILVLCPKLAEYGAHIDAVFGRDSGRSPHIPMTVSDSAGPDTRAVFSLAGMLLALPQGGMSAAEVAAILESPVTLARLRFDDDATARVRRHIANSGVSRGADREHRAESADMSSVSGYGTWHDFLSRLRLGFALAPTEGKLFPDNDSGTSPLALSGSTMLDIDGALAERIARLLALRASCKAKKTFAAHTRDFIAEVNEWIPERHETFTDEARALRTVLNRIAKESEGAGHTEEIGRAAFVEWLRPVLEQGESGVRAAGDGVDFRAMRAHRVTPARVVALLGINAGDFPRTARADAFDPLRASPKPGDPDKTAEDRGVFLEALLTARERLIITFTGRDPVDDSQLPRSPVLDELLAALGAETGVTQHPPFPHSAAYHGPEAERAGLFTYDAAAVARTGAESDRTPGLFAAEDFVRVPEPEAAVEKNTAVDWRDVREHFCDRAKHLLKRRLDIAPDEPAPGLPEDESPDSATRSLDRHKRFQSLLKTGDANRDGRFRAEIADGTASPTGLGRLLFDEDCSRAEAVRAANPEIFTPGRPPPVESAAFNAMIGPVRVRFSETYFASEDGGILLVAASGSPSEKRRAGALLDSRLLALHPAGKYQGALLRLTEMRSEKARSTDHLVPDAETARLLLVPFLREFIALADRPDALNIEARLALAEDEAGAITPKELLKKTAPAFGDIPRPCEDMLLRESGAAEIEPFDEAEIARRRDYERMLWKIPPGKRSP